MVGENSWPCGWTELPLDECMSAIIDYRGKTPRKTTLGIPLVTAKIVKNGRIETPSEFIDPQDYDTWMRRGLPERGDVVMTTEAPLGEIAQLDDTKVALAQRLITLRGKPNLLDNTFLKFLMQSGFVQGQLTARASGTTVLGIKQSELRRVSLVVPPLQEQKAIASILGALDDKIELNRRMNETLESMARAIFKSWFVDFDPVRAKMDGRQPPGMDEATAAMFPDSMAHVEVGLVPSGWTIEPVGEVVQSVGGATPSTNDPKFWEGGKHNWATPKDLSGIPCPILLDTDRRITDEGVAKISSGLLPSGTLLLSSRAPVGYLAIAHTPVAVNQGFIAMVCNERASNYFMLQWCHHNMDQIEGRASGTTFQEISKKNFRPIPMLLPPTELVSAFTEIVSPVYSQMVTNLCESRTLAALRDTLLPKLLSGELRVGEAEKQVEAAV